MKNIVLNINKVKLLLFFLWLVFLSPVRNIFLLKVMERLSFIFL